MQEDVLTLSAIDRALLMEFDKNLTQEVISYRDIGSALCASPAPTVSIGYTHEDYESISGEANYDISPEYEFAIINSEYINKIADYKSRFLNRINSSNYVNSYFYKMYLFTVVERLLSTTSELIRVSVWTLLIILTGILKNLGRDGAGYSDEYVRKLREKIRLQQIHLSSELIERALDTYGIHPSLRDEKARIIFTILHEAALETNSLNENIAKGIKKSFNKSLPELSEEEIKRIIQRGREKPWTSRTSRAISPYQWIKDNYKEWIFPARMLQGHLLAADRQLYNAFKQRVLREGSMPEWLDLPTEKDAVLRRASTEQQRTKIAQKRESNRMRMREVRMSQS